MKAVTIIAGKEVNRKMISEAIQLDRISYDDLFQLQEDICVDYYTSNCYIYIMALDEESNSVIGYINFSPVKESVYKKLKSGIVVDTVISGEDVLPYNNGETYFGYFSSIVVHPEFRRCGIATKMLSNWSNFVFQLAVERKIYFTEIVADAVSEAGMYLLSKIGFSVCRLSSHGTTIMTLNIAHDSIEKTTLNEKLIDEYRNNYKRGGMSDAV